MRPPHFLFLTPPPPPPGADGYHRGRGHVGRHCPYTNNIWCGSVHALMRYRSKTAKMLKFPIDSHSNENFICPFFPPAGGRQPPKGEKTHPEPEYAGMQTLNRPAGCREIVDRTNKQKNNKCVSKTDTNPPFAFQIAFPRGTDFTGFLQGRSKSGDLQSEIFVRIESRIESADSRLQLQC